MGSSGVDRNHPKKKKQRLSSINDPAQAAPIASTSTSTLTSSPIVAPLKRKIDQVEQTATPTGAEADDVDSAEQSQNGDEESTKELSKLDKAKAKKRRKELQKAIENPPSFAFDTRGFKGGKMVQIKDVRDFVLHLLSDEKAQQWLFVANKRNVQRVVTLMIPGITPSTLGLAQPSVSANLPFALTPAEGSSSKLPIFQSLFSHACPTKAPGDKYKLHSCYQHFINCPLSNGEKERREKNRKEQGRAKASTDPSIYLLSPDQMMEQAYPTPTRSSKDPSSSSDQFEDWKRDDGWVEAPFEPFVDGMKRDVLGIDCEMCLTEDGSELTRVSVVNLEGKNIYDTLVKPDKPILDYLTRFSGLTEEKLSNTTKRLIDVQQDLSKLIKYNTILIGHSLECDLRVLKLIHSFIIDTSVVYQHPRGPPFKASLKWLAQKWLKREIQLQPTLTPTPTGEIPSIGGHDSAEDALTCIDLLKLKLEKGPGFGEFQNDQETIFERLGRGSDVKRCAVVDHGMPGQWHGAKAGKAVACTSDQEVVDGVLDCVKDGNGEGFDLIVGRLMELSHALGWSQPSNAALGKSSTTLPGINVLPTPATPSIPSQPLESVYSQLNALLAKLHSSLPPLTALIIFTGHDSPLEMSRLSAKKANFDRLWKTVKQSEIKDEDRWMESDDRKLLDEVERTRVGLSFYCVKS